MFPFSGKTQNLISNPSFEDIDSCYGNASPIGFDVFDWSNCIKWDCPTNASSDLWCENPTLGVITPPQILGFGFQFPKSGENFAGLYMFELTEQNYREYIQNKLSTPLQSNIYYKFSLYVSTNEDSLNYSSCLQAYFSTNPISSSNYFVLPLIPQWKNDPQNFIKDTIGWQLVSGVFKANGGEQYVTIGCFDDSANVVMKNKDPFTTSDLYYFIDDVSLEVAPIEIEFPNVFTPSKDEINELYTPKIKGLAEYEIFIFNRWGNKVAVLDENNPSWDGKNATQGVYYYCLKENEYNIIEQGFFQLFR